MNDTPTIPEEATHPGVAAERLALDAEAVVERIHETLGGVTATRTDEGMTFRTSDGTLVALLTPVEDEDGQGVLSSTGPRRPRVARRRYSPPQTTGPERGGTGSGSGQTSSCTSASTISWKALAAPTPVVTPS
jgi:hypothetical protein